MGQTLKCLPRFASYFKVINFFFRVISDYNIPRLLNKNVDFFHEYDMIIPYKNHGGVTMVGRRKLTTAEQLEKLNEIISAKEEELKKLRIQRKELEAQKKQEDLSELYNIITASGNSMEEIKAMLAK